MTQAAGYLDSIAIEPRLGARPTGRAERKRGMEDWLLDRIARLLSRTSERRAVRAFQRAAQRVPAYRDLLSKNAIHAAEVQDIGSYRDRVPITDKQSLFAQYPPGDLCVDGRMTDAAAIFTSSGHSGVFSFGTESRKDERRMRKRIDRLLSFYISARRRRTLVINALPAGVRVPCSVATMVDTSTRPDAVLAVVREAGPSFDQIGLIGEHPFLKEVIERGVETGLDWKQFRVHILAGGEVMPENFRRYIGSILGHNPEKPERGLILVSLGISELGLSIGHESPEVAQIRRLAHEDPRIRRALFGDTPFVPTLVQYDPLQWHMETPRVEEGRSRLAVSTLDSSRRLPLIRYSTGDWAQVFTRQEMCDRLKACGLGHLPLRLPWPILAMWGRGQAVRVGTTDIFPEQVKEAIYADPTIARSLTGNFQLRRGHDMLQICLHLKEGVAPTKQLMNRLDELMSTYLPVPHQLSCVPYHEMATSYQRKFRYLRDDESLASVA